MKVLFISGLLLIALIFVSSAFRFLASSLKLPLGILLFFFALSTIIVFLRKKERRLQDYLITSAIVLFSITYPLHQFEVTTQIATNAVLAIITIFLMLAMAVFWNFAKHSTKVNKRSVAFFSVIMLIFFIIVFYSWMYNLLIVFDTPGGLRFGGCNENDLVLLRDSANQYSLYYSAITFTTVGYGDICPQGKWFRLIAGLEAITGILSIPTFFYILSRPE